MNNSTIFNVWSQGVDAYRHSHLTMTSFLRFLCQRFIPCLNKFLRYVDQYVNFFVYRLIIRCRCLSGKVRLTLTSFSSISLFFCYVPFLKSKSNMLTVFGVWNDWMVYYFDIFLSSRLSLPFTSSTRIIHNDKFMWY